MGTELANWFNENVQVIMTTLGLTGTAGGAFAGVWAFVKGLKTTIIDKFKDSETLLQKQVDELKEQNRVLMDYVKTSAEAKANSGVLDEETKYKFDAIANEANTFASKFKQIVEDTKGLF